MLHATRGIVFHSLPYSDTSVIVKIYTELFGIQSYLVKGARRPGSKFRAAYFQVMTLLELVAYHKETASLQSLKEVRIAHPYASLPFDIRKSSVVLFINELATRAIREEEANPGLFAFLWETCLELDRTTENVAEFPLQFAVALMNPTGIFPRNNHSEQTPWFDLREGLFQPAVPSHPQYLDRQTSAAFSNLLTTTDCRLPTADWQPSPSSRAHLLEILLRYYRLHLPGFGEMQSHHILHEVLA
ncbi:MAG TPA: DNA repair protein RecO [Bacteroidales bacterium]|nr:DNA repair protein RecO [Bacteroidales bacterium]HPS62095.1 DNA repair protein RecO [Bacteroidales bacterium]